MVFMVASHYEMPNRVTFLLLQACLVGYDRSVGDCA